MVVAKGYFSTERGWMGQRRADRRSSVFLGSPFTTALGGGKEEGGTPEAVERVEERQEAD